MGCATSRQAVISPINVTRLMNTRLLREEPFSESFIVTMISELGVSYRHWVGNPRSR